MPTEYYEGPVPSGEGWIQTGYQQCDIRCVLCLNTIPAHIIVNIKDCPGGIDYVSNFLVKNKALHICESCFTKIGFKLGPLDKVKDK